MKWKDLNSLPNGVVAQLAEHLFCKEKGVGSNPISSTKLKNMAINKTTRNLLLIMEELYSKMPYMESEELQYTIAANLYDEGLKELEKTMSTPLRFRGIVMIRSEKAPKNRIILSAKDENELVGEIKSFKD